MYWLNKDFRRVIAHVELLLVGGQLSFINCNTVTIFIMDSIDSSDIYEVPPDVESSIRDYHGNFNKREIDIDEKIESLISEIRNSDTQILLEKLTIMTLSGNLLIMASEKGDQIVLPPRLAEYAMGLVSVYGGNKGSEPEMQEIAGCAQDVKNLYTAKKITETDEDSNNYEHFKNRVELASLNRELTTGRFVLSNQYGEAAKRSYRPYDDILEREIGFNIDDAVKFTNYISQYNYVRWKWLFENHTSTDLSRLTEKDHYLSNIMSEINEKGNYVRDSESETFIQDCELIEAIYNDFEANSHALWMPEASLHKHFPDEYDEKKFELFLDRMSVDVGRGNEASVGKYFYPHNFNPVHKHPIFKIGEDYIIPRFRVLQWALVETFYYDLIDLPNYEGQFGEKFGNYLEKWTRDELGKIFPESEIFINPDRGNAPPNEADEATDVLVTHNDDLYIFECKTGKLPLDTRKGQYDPIESEINKKIGKGHGQAVDLIEDIENGSLETVVANDMEINVSDYDNFHSTVIVGEPYDTFSTSLIDEFLDTEKHDSYVTDIYSLQSITELLDSPDIFTEYIEGRKLLYNNKIMSPHELDYLGLFLHKERGFPEIPEDRFVTIGDFSEMISELVGGKFGI